MTRPLAEVPEELLTKMVWALDVIEDAEFADHYEPSDDDDEAAIDRGLQAISERRFCNGRGSALGVGIRKS